MSDTPPAGTGVLEWAEHGEDHFVGDPEPYVEIHV